MHQAHSQRGTGGHTPLRNASVPADQKLKIFLMLKIAFFCLPEMFCDQKACQNAFSTPLPRLLPIQRLWRLHMAPQRLGHFDRQRPPLMALPAQVWCFSAALGLVTGLLCILPTSVTLVSLIVFLHCKSFMLLYRVIMLLFVYTISFFPQCLFSLR